MNKKSFFIKATFVTRSPLLVLFLFVSSFVMYAQEKPTLKALHTLLNEATNNDEQASTLFKIGDFHYQNNHLDSARIYFNKTIKIAENNQLLLKANSNSRLGGVFHKEGKPSKVLEYLNLALEDYKTLNLNSKVSATLVNMAAAYNTQNDVAKSISLYEEAQVYAIDELKPNIYIGLASAYASINQYEKALELLNSALKICNTENLETTKAYIYVKMADINVLLKNYDNALTYFTKALELKKKNELPLVVINNNIGDLYEKLNDLKKAKEYYIKALKANKASKNENFDATIKLNLVNLEISEGDHSNAIVKINDLKKTFEKLNIISSVAESDILLGKASLGLKQYDKAIIQTEKGLQTALSLNKIELAKKAINQFVTIHLDKKDYKKAIYYKDELEKYNEILNSENKSKAIEGLKIQFQVENIKQDLKIKNQEVALLVSQKKSSNYRNLFLGLALAGLLFFFYRQNALNKSKKKALTVEKELAEVKEQQANEKIKYKNSEITKYAIHINERNKLLEGLNLELKQIKKQSEEQSTRRSIQNLQTFVSETMDVNKGKIILNSSAKTTEESFVYNLKQKYPKLTPKEVEIATYLSLNLSSKQIANNLNISFQTVNNYRLSIRKKMNLKKEDSITAFIRTI